MTFPPTIIPPFTIFFLLFTHAAVAQIPPTAYEILQEYDFPVGLLPTNITSYTLNRDTGVFHVNLGNKCTFANDGYEVKYEPMISGVIKKDKLSQLRGVSVKLLFFWTDIVKATRDKGELSISVGLLSAGFDVDMFEESPECGCGFHCVGSETKSREDMDQPWELLDWSM
ncbi:hypothetical protein SSX86_026924 [Deinandra increscens subsp. villosa]|uniref:Uncharacterized protein n=1 Tax=Deinandra increscens subsp. villosa TaxID=3103831 RepID=A0AAP0CMB1_9ASTR